VLGGVTIPFDRGLSGYSDADPLVHAVIDALLGAACAGNIGTHFPDTEPEWRDAVSTNLLEQTVAILDEKGVRIENIDTVLIAEEPKLGQFVAAMCETIARAAGIEPGRVSVKPKTADRMGSIGAGEGIAAIAVALADVPE